MMVAYDAHDYRQARSLARSILIQANPLLKDLDTDEKRTLYVKAYYFFSLSGVKDINKAEGRKDINTLLELRSSANEAIRVAPEQFIRDYLAQSYLVRAAIHAELGLAKQAYADRDRALALGRTQADLKRFLAELGNPTLAIRELPSDRDGNQQQLRHARYLLQQYEGVWEQWNRKPA
jgi:hypothetical protein